MIQLLQANLFKRELLLLPRDNLSNLTHGLLRLGAVRTSRYLTGVWFPTFLLGGLSLLPPGVLAQEQQLVLEEVLVTAQRKQESLQDTPISVMSFNSEQLLKKGITSLEGIQGQVPGLTIEPFPTDSTNLRIFIRGVGLIDAQVSQDPAVGVYLDGAYIARSSGLAMEIADLERIEVLRGPQGTLYGRNSTGGTVNLITKKPDPEAFHINQYVTLGNRNLASSRTSANVPLWNAAAIKLTYLTSQRDGFVDNASPGADFGDKDVEGYRISFGWDITPRFRVDYSYDKSDTDFVNYAPQAVTPQILSGDTSAAGVISDGLAREAREFVPFSDKRFSKMSTPVPLMEAFNDVEGHILVSSWDTGGGEINYIGAYRTLLNSSPFDFSTGSSSPQFRVDNGAFTAKDGSLHFPGAPKGGEVLDQEQWSHELQYRALVFNERLEVLTGLYFFTEEASVNDGPMLRHEFTSPFQRDTDPVTGVTTTASISTLTNNLQKIDNKASALYTRFTWTPPILEDQLRLILGYRHTREQRKAFKFAHDAQLEENEVEDAQGNTLSATTTTLADITFSAQGDNKFRDDAFEFIVQYNVTPAINTYAKVAEAFKSGGFNAREADEAFYKRGFDEETATSYELGIKSEFFQQRLRVNADVFLTEFKDRQMNFNIPDDLSATRVINAGESEIQGLELEATYAASRYVILSLSYAYLDTDVVKVADPFTGEDASDNFVFASAPKNAFSVDIDWTLATFAWGRLAVHANYSFVDEKNGTPRVAGVPGARQDSVELINARVGLSDIPVGAGTLTAAVWGKNLQDDDYVVNAFTGLPHTERAVLWGEPRSYGLDLIYNY